MPDKISEYRTHGHPPHFADAGLLLAESAWVGEDSTTAGG